MKAVTMASSMVVGFVVKDVGEAGAGVFERLLEGEESLRDGERVGAGEADDADAASAGRGGDGDDGVGLHPP